MPLPIPGDDESRDDFIERCMGNPTMNEDFPDTDQRFAVCSQQWDEGKMSTTVSDLKTNIKDLKEWLDSLDKK